MKGFMSFPQPVEEHKVRGKPEKFADHYTQATLFYESQTDIEKAHIIRAFRFELTRVQVTAIRERVVAQLRNVSEELAVAVADGLGMELPPPQPKVLENPPKPEVTKSPALSLFARPGTMGIRTRKIALLVADGVDGEAMIKMHEALSAEGAVPRFVGPKMGAVTSATGEPIEVEVSMEAAPPVLFDALIVADGDAVDVLSKLGHAVEFLKNQYRHCKPILLFGRAAELLQKAGIPPALPSGKPDPGLLQFKGSEVEAAIPAFVESLTKHRHFERETDPPMV
jgi:catalase